MTGQAIDLEQAPQDMGTHVTREEIEELKRSSRNEIEELKRLIQVGGEKMPPEYFDAEVSLQGSRTGKIIRTRSSSIDSERKMSIVVSSSDHGTLMHDGIHEYTHLSEDTFSFLIAARVTSMPYFTGIVVVAVKIMMYSLIFADLLAKGSPGNTLGIAASIEIPVAISQILAVIITVITQDDLITALQLIHSGFGVIGDAFQYASSWKWFFSVFGLFVVGAYGLLVTFLLIITSSDAVDLILNFTAIESISLLDNIVFQLSSSGFFGTSNRAVTRIVKDTEYPQVRAASKVPWLQIVLLLVSFLGMIAGLIVVFVFQANGAFLPSHLIVQFDDEVRPDLGTFSGLFSQQLSNGLIAGGGRVSYWNKIGDGSIGYCSELEAWTFGHSRSDFCDDIMALSESPTTLDISRVLGQTWYVRIPQDKERILPMEGLFSAIACSTDLDCGGSDHGSCLGGLCECQDGFFGLRCNYIEEQVCDTIRVDEQTDEFTGLRRTVAFKYNVLRDVDGRLVLAYNHPVYVTDQFDPQNREKIVDVMLYTGLRWMLSGVPPTNAGLHAYFGPSFHASSKTLGDIEATTDVVPFNTATDERPAPTNMEWFLPGSQEISEMDPVLGINTVLVCSKCGEYNPCAFNNICADDGTCNCVNGEKGSLCQVIPVGDGSCDEYFNLQEFGYDGGDCCEASCQSSQVNQCGISSDDSFDVDTVPVGFPFCRDPDYGCSDDDIDCWTAKSNAEPGIHLLIKKSSGAFVTLSANGRTLLVSEPELDTVRVFDQVDAGWVQRGQTLEGDAKSRFGSLVAITTLPGVVARRRSGKVPVSITVASKGETSNYVEVYTFEPHGLLWERVGQRLRFGTQRIDSISIGSSGPNITLAVGLRETNQAHVYKRNNLVWKLTVNTTGSSVGLSGNGKTIVCLSTDPPEGSEGSGVFDVESLGPIADDDIENNRIVTERSLTLPNLLPFGTHNFAFKSRPVRIQLSYDGTYGVGFGQNFPGAYGLNGLSMLGLKRDEGASTFITERLSDFGVDVNETTRIFYAVSTDTQYFAMNSLDRFIEIFDIEAQVDDPFWVRRYPNTSVLPTFEVDSFENAFAISDRGSVMAVVIDDRVEVVQRSSSCNGADVRLVVTLDEEPGSISWSMDYVGSLANTTYTTENIAKCQNCYAGDPRYTRVVVVEDFCIPKEIAACVQLTFSTGRDRLGDGAGFIGLKDGEVFATYDGASETVTKIRGICHHDCAGLIKFDMIMSFEGGYPNAVISPHTAEPLWSSLIHPLPGVEGRVMLQRCLPVNETGIFTVEGSGGVGSYEVYLDNNLFVRQTFDIGKSQTFFVSPPDENQNLLENTPALCSNSSSCPLCSVCEEGMIVDPDKINFAGFDDISCSDLSALGVSGKINPDFCSLYPTDVSSLCGCHRLDCDLNEVLLQVDIIFDQHPEDIAFEVVDGSGSVVWKQGFTDYTPTVIDGAVAFETCVQNEGPLYFTITDSGEDGLCCGTDTDYVLPDGIRRGYNVSLDEELVGSREFTIGSEQTLILRAGRNSSLMHVSQPSVWCQDCDRCDICPDGGSYELDEFFTLPLYGTIHCFDYAANMNSYIDTEFCATYQAHIASSCGCVNHEHSCEEGESILKFRTDYAAFLRGVTVQIRDQFNSTMWSKVGFIGNIDQQVQFEACIPSFQLTFVGIYNNNCDVGVQCSFDDSDMHFFEFYLDNELTYNETFVGSEIEVTIGSENTDFPVTTLAPTTVYEPGPEDSCLVCGQDLAVTIPDAIVEISSFLRLSCAEFAQLGLMGYLTVDICTGSAEFISTRCGCASLAAPSLSPLTTTLGPSEEEEGFKGPNPSCNICGEGNEVTLLHPSVIIPGQEIAPTCAEFAEGGFAGLIPAESCHFVPDLVFDLCGCAAAP